MRDEKKHEKSLVWIQLLFQIIVAFATTGLLVVVEGKAESDPDTEASSEGEAAYGYGIGSIYGRPGFEHKYTNPHYKSLPVNRYAY